MLVSPGNRAALAKTVLKDPVVSLAPKAALAKTERMGAPGKTGLAPPGRQDRKANVVKKAHEDCEVLQGCGATRESKALPD